jgi:flavin reductase (DIM6/NTAB) family NADH-FMN oxidoreductase RutF
MARSGGFGKLRQAKAVDWCGTVSGRDVDKFTDTGLTPAKALKVLISNPCQMPVLDPMRLACRSTEA